MDKDFLFEQQWAHLEQEAKALLAKGGMSADRLAAHTSDMLALAEKSGGMDDGYGEKLVALSRRILPTHPDMAVQALAAVVYYCPAGLSEANALARDLIADHKDLFVGHAEARRRVGLNETDILKAHRDVAEARAEQALGRAYRLSFDEHTGQPVVGVPSGIKSVRHSRPKSLH